jgi:hypothetical protein
MDGVVNEFCLFCISTAVGKRGEAEADEKKNDGSDAPYTQRDSRPAYTVGRSDSALELDIGLGIEATLSSGFGDEDDVDDDDLFNGLPEPTANLESLLAQLGTTPDTFTPGQNAGNSTRMISEWGRDRDGGNVVLNLLDEWSQSESI